MKSYFTFIFLTFVASSVIAEPAPELLMQQRMYLPPPAVELQLDNALSSKCQEKLEFYREKSTTQNGSIDLYYKFMLKKWEDRCINK